MIKMYHPVITLNGERIVYHHLLMSLGNALLVQWFIISMYKIQSDTLREICRDTLKCSFERIGQRDMARAMDLPNQCQILEFRRG